MLCLSRIKGHVSLMSKEDQSALSANTPDLTIKVGEGGEQTNDFPPFGLQNKFLDVIGARTPSILFRIK